MKFIYATELKRCFDVYGHFYDLKIEESVFQCRSELSIVRRGSRSDLPDMIIVMMNPGSSAPSDKAYETRVYTPKEYFNIKSKELVSARPDSTQYQIMRLMLNNGWEFVRILNLSDLRNGNSGKFQIEFRTAMKRDNTNPHCITHRMRKGELSKALMSKGGIIMAAWGDIAELKSSAEAILCLDKKIIGLKKKQSSPHFRHPSPHLKAHKLAWLKQIQEEIDKI